MCSCNHEGLQGFYLHSCSPPESPADSRMIEGDWRTPATRGCPAHHGGAVEVCRVSSALMSCLLSSVTLPRTTQAAPQPLLQTLGKYWHTAWSNFTWLSWCSVRFSDGADGGVSSRAGLTSSHSHLHLQRWETSACKQNSLFIGLKPEKYIETNYKGVYTSSNTDSDRSTKQMNSAPTEFLCGLSLSVRSCLPLR